LHDAITTGQPVQPAALIVLLFHASTCTLLVVHFKYWWCNLLRCLTKVCTLFLFVDAFTAAQVQQFYMAFGNLSLRQLGSRASSKPASSKAAAAAAASSKAAAAAAAAAETLL
jgi:hypothetical protein